MILHLLINYTYYHIIKTRTYWYIFYIIDIPVNEADKHGNLAILVTSGGGHVGYLDTFWPFTNNNFMLKLIQQYFEAIMVDKNYEKFVNL